MHKLYIDTENIFVFLRVLRLKYGYKLIQKKICKMVMQNAKKFQNCRHSQNYHFDLFSNFNCIVHQKIFFGKFSV